MNPGIIAFIVIYCVVLCCYFFTETSGNMKLRAPNKITLALMFFIFGAYFICTQWGQIHYLALAALFLAMMGDIFLLFSFQRGGDFFLAGNICFTIYEIMILQLRRISISQFWWVLLVVSLLVSLFAFLFYKFQDIFKLGVLRLPMLMYLTTIILNGTFGIALVAYVPNFLLFGIGTFLFMLSDFDIVLHKFVFPKSKFIHRLNSALYFTGLLLIVLNFALI
ncbi:MAG: lysoplasmalogenase [Bacilli bacterium]|nr:lysoplasmalogenase [Bacilli bacterium]